MVIFVSEIKYSEHAAQLKLCNCFRQKEMIFIRIILYFLKSVSFNVTIKISFSDNHHSSVTQEVDEVLVRFP